MLLDTYKVIFGRLEPHQAPTETPNDFLGNLEKNKKKSKNFRFFNFFGRDKVDFPAPKSTPKLF